MKLNRILLIVFMILLLSVSVSANPPAPAPASTVVPAAAPASGDDAPTYESQLEIVNSDPTGDNFIKIRDIDPTKLDDGRSLILFKKVVGENPNDAMGVFEELSAMTPPPARIKEYEAMIRKSVNENTVVAKDGTNELASRYANQVLAKEWKASGNTGAAPTVTIIGNVELTDKNEFDLGGMKKSLSDFKPVNGKIIIRILDEYHGNKALILIQGEMTHNKDVISVEEGKGTAYIYHDNPSGIWTPRSRKEHIDITGTGTLNGKTFAIPTTFGENQEKDIPMAGITLQYKDGQVHSITPYAMGMYPTEDVGANLPRLKVDGRILKDVDGRPTHMVMISPNIDGEPLDVAFEHFGKRAGYDSPSMVFKKKDLATMKNGAVIVKNRELNDFRGDATFFLGSRKEGDKYRSATVDFSPKNAGDLGHDSYTNFEMIVRNKDGQTIFSNGGKVKFGMTTTDTKDTIKIKTDKDPGFLGLFTVKDKGKFEVRSHSEDMEMNDNIKVAYKTSNGFEMIVNRESKNVVQSKEKDSVTMSLTDKNIEVKKGLNTVYRGTEIAKATGLGFEANLRKVGEKDNKEDRAYVIRKGLWPIVANVDEMNTVASHIESVDGKKSQNHITIEKAKFSTNFLGLALGIGTAVATSGIARIPYTFAEWYSGVEAGTGEITEVIDTHEGQKTIKHEGHKLNVRGAVATVVTQDSGKDPSKGVPLIIKDVKFPLFTLDLTSKPDGIEYAISTDEEGEVKVKSAIVATDSKKMIDEAIPNANDAASADKEKADIPTTTNPKGLKPSTPPAVATPPTSTASHDSTTPTGTEKLSKLKAKIHGEWFSPNRDVQGIENGKYIFYKGKVWKPGEGSDKWKYYEVKDQSVAINRLSNEAKQSLGIYVPPAKTTVYAPKDVKILQPANPHSEGKSLGIGAKFSDGKHVRFYSYENKKMYVYDDYKKDYIADDSFSLKNLNNEAKNNLNTITYNRGFLGAEAGNSKSGGKKIVDKQKAANYISIIDMNEKRAVTILANQPGNKLLHTVHSWGIAADSTDKFNRIVAAANKIRITEGRSPLVVAVSANDPNVFSSDEVATSLKKYVDNPAVKKVYTKGSKSALFGAYRHKDEITKKVGSNSKYSDDYDGDGHWLANSDATVNSNIGNLDSIKSTAYADRK
jgi:hypothetical protein